MDPVGLGLTMETEDAETEGADSDTRSDSRTWAVETLMSWRDRYRNWVRQDRHDHSQTRQTYVHADSHKRAGTAAVDSGGMQVRSALSKTELGQLPRSKHNHRDLQDRFKHWLPPPSLTFT